MLTLEQEEKIRKEVEVFQSEYPEYDDEYVSDYLACCEDYTPEMKKRFAMMLGY